MRDWGWIGLDGLPHDYATALNRGHGRIERRERRAADGTVCLEYLSIAGARPGGEGGAPPGDGGWSYGRKPDTASAAWRRRHSASLRQREGAGAPGIRCTGAWT